MIGAAPCVAFEIPWLLWVLLLVLLLLPEGDNAGVTEVVVAAVPLLPVAEIAVLGDTTAAILVLQLVEMAVPGDTAAAVGEGLDAEPCVPD